MSEKPLLGVYLFNGDDELKKEMLVSRLKLRIEKQDETMMNIQIVTESIIQTSSHLSDILNTIPFGCPARLVIIKDVDAWKKQHIETLVEYIASPLETTILAMTAKKLARNTRLYKAIERNSTQSIIDCTQIKRSELPQLIQGMAKSEGVDIAQLAASALIERVGVSTVSLSTEIKKLTAIVLGVKRKIITEEDVRLNVERIVEPKSWDLTNALALRNLSLCLELLNRMKGYTETGLFIICVARIREILTAQVLLARKESVAKYMGKQDWQVREIVRGAALYKNEELIALLEQAPVLEKQMKTGTDPKELLEEWIIGACINSLAKRNS